MPRALPALLIMLIAALSLGGLSKLEVDLRYEDFFSQDLAQRRALQAHHDRWGPDDNVLTLVMSRPDGAPLTDEAGLRAMVEVCDQLGQLPQVALARCLVDQPLLVGPGRAPAHEEQAVEQALRMKPLLRGVGEVFPSTRERLEREQAPPGGWAAAIALQPEAVPFFLSEDGRVAGAHLELTVEARADIQESVTALLGEADRLERELGLTLRLAGARMMQAEVTRLLVSDQLRLLPLAVVFMMTLIWWGSRSWRAAAGPALAAGLSMLGVAGILGWMGRPLGLLNQVLLTLTPALVIADGLHLVHRFQLERSRGRAPEEAVTASLYAVFPAVVLTSLTSGLAFLSLLSADLEIVRALAAPAACATALGCGVVLLVVPLCLRVTPPAPRPEPRSASLPLLEAALRRAPAITLLGALLGVMLLPAAMGLPAESHLTALLPPGNPARVNTRALEQDLGGSVAFAVVLEGDLQGRPTLLAVERFVAQVEADPRVREVLSPARLILEVEQAIYGSAEPPPRVSRRLIEGLREDGGAALIDEEASAGRALVFFADMPVAETLALAEHVERLAQAELVEGGLESQITGSALLAYRGLASLMDDLQRGLLGAALVILLALTLVFPQPRVLAAALLPNALPFLASLAALRGLELPMSPGPAMVLAIGMGLCVDDTIHVLLRARESQRGLGGLAEGVSEVVAPMTLSSGALAVAFAVFWGSTFPTLAAAGAVGFVMVVSAALCDLVLLPCGLRLALGAAREVRSPLLDWWER